MNRELAGLVAVYVIMPKSVSESLAELVSICDEKPETIDLTLEDCQNLYRLISELRFKLSVSQQKLCDYDRFYDDIQHAVKRLEDSGSTHA